MKKLLSLLLALCLLLSCGLAEAPTTPTDLEPTAVPTSEPTAEPTAEPTVEPTKEPTLEPTLEPTVEPTEEPTVEPTEELPADSTEEPTAEPTPEPSDTPTAEPSAEPSPAPEGDIPAEATAEPTAEPTIEPTLDPTAEPTLEPTVEPTPEATSSPADGSLYVLVDGVRLYGKPAALIPMGLVIYLYDTTVVEITGYTADQLGQVKFALDPQVFTAEDDCIYLSVRDPNGFVKQDTFFLWAGKKGDMATPTPALDSEGAVMEHEILVTALDYSAEEPCRPTFQLAAAPALEEGMGFAVIIGEGDPQPIGSSYAPDASGTYRFALLAADGTVLHRSAKYTVTIPQPTATPTPEPTATPSPEPTATPTVEPTATPSPEPTAEPTAEPTQAPTPESSIVPAAPETTISAQAWTHAGDMRTEGDLADMLLTDGSVIYICTSRIIVLDGGNAQLAGKTLLPDPDIFGSDCVVRISGENEDVERAESLFVWVEAKGAASVTTAALSVAPDAYTAGQWASIVPSFVLASSPTLEELGPGYAYAVSVDGGAPIILSDSVYPALEEGQYSLRFLLLAPDGDPLDASADYALALDYTAPLMQVRSGNGTLQVTVGDALSGGEAVSLDGGATWNPLTLGEGGVASYTHTVTGTQSFPMGSIIVRDKAGVTTFYPEEVTVRKISSGGRGGSNRTTSHAASTEDTVTAYDGVELILDDGRMTQLTLGEDALELTLHYTGTEPDAAQPAFTALFSDLTEDGVQDTLTLTAAGVTDATAADYQWIFSGQVCKKLSASGIDYLMLRAGDQLALLPTSGFTSGLRYNMYRADGLVSKDFSYALTMDADAGMSLQVTVEEATYPMSSDPTAEFYYYDLFCGDTQTFAWAVRMYQKMR